MSQHKLLNRDPRAAIWWIRRDLRLHDNRALQQAVANGGSVYPVFVLDPAILNSDHNRHAARRKNFLFGALHSLDAELRKRGSRLIIRRGDPVRELASLVAETGAGIICAEEDYSPYARRRDSSIARHLPLKLFPGVSVHHPANVLKADGKPYSVFTPFSRSWKILPLPTGREMLGPPGKIVTSSVLASENLPDWSESSMFPASEVEARGRLRAFADGRLSRYSEYRNRMDLEGTSALSPYFRFGLLSVREAAVLAHTVAAMESASRQESGGAETWLNELIWRDFYLSVLYHFPHVLREAFNPAFREIRWRHDPAALKSWQEGRTGYSVVDAGMRQLLSAGWMHNRARMIVASFLVKDLLIDWREGEAWFMRNLVDGDPAANNGGWQWAAGVGTDAAPYFRVFNPVLQGRKFDPRGDYIRSWVPQLGHVPDKYIHEPWTMPASEQAAAGCVIGKHYPAPIIDHPTARNRALAAYARTTTKK